MSKRDLKKYLTGLKKKQLEQQIIDIYTRFKPVKEYYDFAFNPNEEKLINEAKFKINKEYFPEGRRKAKKRRSVAHRYVKKYKLLNVEPFIIADIMLFNIETAQKYSATNNMNDTFFTSMLKSFTELIEYVKDNGLYIDFKTRIENIANNAWEQNWINKLMFENINSNTDNNDF